MKYLFLSLLLLPGLASAQAVSRIDSQQVKIHTDLDQAASCFTAGGIFFGLAIMTPYAITISDDLTLDQIESRQDAVRLVTLGTAVVGVICIAAGADKLRHWKPVAGPGGVGIGFTLK